MMRSASRSRVVDPGDEPPLAGDDGFKIGLMTRDLRFPVSWRCIWRRRRTLVLPAAWVRGPLKEHHWATLLAARALDTTRYVVAAGECGTKNIARVWPIRWG